jgi:hypothetical protein
MAGVATAEASSRSVVGQPRPKFRLPSHARKAVLTLHVLSSVGWFGIGVAVMVCVIAAQTVDQPLAGALSRAVAASAWVSVPAGLLAIATGTVVGLGTRFGLIRHWWVVIKILLALVVVAGDALLVPVQAGQLIDTDQAVPLIGTTAGHIVALVVATAVSVVKPGGLTPWGRRVRAVRKALRPT